MIYSAIASALIASYRLRGPVIPGFVFVLALAHSLLGVPFQPFVALPAWLQP